MRCTLKFSFPDAADLKTELVANIHHRFHDGVTSAERERDQALEEIDRLGRYTETLRAEFRPGQPTQEIEQTIARRNALELVQSAMERAVEDAKAAMDAAQLDARQRVLAKAVEYRDAIQGSLDELSAILDRVKDVEMVLDQAVARLGLPGVEEVAAIVWPRPRVDDFRLLNYPDRSIVTPSAARA